MNARRKAAGGIEASPAGAEAELPSAPLSRLRLLVALDALLVEGSVKGAARALDMSTPAMSRLLSQLRVLFGDEILMRTGRGMVPTPLAEQLRTRVRALATEADQLIRQEPAPTGARADPLRRPIVQHPPLAISPTLVVEGEPDAGVIARRLGTIGADAEPKQRLARYIALTGAGVGQSRPLSEAEAEDALGIVLDGEADPIQIGALLVALQYRGVTANELAGMVRAARRGCAPLDAHPPAADLDWPAYLSPRNTSPPWFLHAARLVALAGYRVMLHGFARGIGRLHEALDAASVPYSLSVEEAREALGRGAITYMPLPAIDPQLQALNSLYRLFEMRSPLNLVIQLLNPAGAPCSILGVPSAAGRTLQRDAATLLGWPRLVAIGTNRDVAQATPFRATPLLLLDRGEHRELSLKPVQPRMPSNPRIGFSAMEYWRGLWSGAVKDEHAIEVVVATATFALMAAAKGPLDHDRARDRARQLWSERLRA